MPRTQTDAFQELAQADPALAARVLKAAKRAVWVPHSGGQVDVVRSKARFIILRAGRRWGKTEVASHKAITAAISKPNQMVWWVSNSDKNVRRGYRKVKAHLPRELLAKPAPSDGANNRILELINGSMIEFYTAGSVGKSADSDASALTGEGVNFLVVDEAALIQEQVWFQHLRPTLSDTGGSAIIISTPRGRNWFWKLWNKGDKQPGGWYESFRFRSIDNPHGLTEEELADVRDTLPRLTYMQEYEAEFTANAASMFVLEGEDEDRGLRWNAVRPGMVQPEGQVVLGVDLAKKEDFTVITGCNADTRLPCFHDRFNTISWAVQQDIVEETVRELEEAPGVEGVTVVVDSTGVGDVVFDNLDDRGLDVVPVNFTSMKERMVRLLAGDIEHSRAFILEAQREEFESYEYEIAPSGRYKFEASTGHDDEVSAKMLENWGVVHEAPPDVKMLDVDDADPDLLPQEERKEWYQHSEERGMPDTPAEIAARPEAWSSFGA